MPTLRVSAAARRRRAASAHRSRRANQNADTESSRNSDSVYGARKKNAVGTAPRTRVRMRRPRRASAGSARTTPTSARKNAPFETRRAAPSGADRWASTRRRERQRVQGEERRAAVVRGVPAASRAAGTTGVLALQAVISMCHPGVRSGGANPESVVAVGPGGAGSRASRPASAEMPNSSSPAAEEHPHDLAQTRRAGRALREVHARTGTGVRADRRLCATTGWVLAPTHTSRQHRRARPPGPPPRSRTSAGASPMARRPGRRRTRTGSRTRRRRPPRRPRTPTGGDREREPRQAATARTAASRPCS